MRKLEPLFSLFFEKRDSLQPAKELDEGTLLSVRGLGRAKLLEIGGVSKKGRIFVRIGLYGKAMSSHYRSR